MIQVLLEIRTGAASFRVSARARSVRRAFGLVRSRYPGAEVHLLLPIEPETFFTGDDFDCAELVTLQTPERAAG